MSFSNFVLRLLSLLCFGNRWVLMLSNVNNVERIVSSRPVTWIVLSWWRNSKRKFPLSLTWSTNLGTKLVLFWAVIECPSYHLRVRSCGVWVSILALFIIWFWLCHLSDAFYIFIYRILWTTVHDVDHLIKLFLKKSIFDKCSIFYKISFISSCFLSRKCIL